LSFGIITKSPLIARDCDLLLRLQERNELQIHISLITHDAVLARKLEARSPVPPRACARCGSWSMPGERRTHRRAGASGHHR